MGLVLGELGLHVVSDDDPAGIEVVVQSFGLAQELRAEQDVVHVQLLADVAGVAYRDRGFDDDGIVDLMMMVGFCVVTPPSAEVSAAPLSLEDS